MWKRLKSIFYSRKHTQDINTATNAKAIVLHCIDFRFIDAINTNLNLLKLHNNYDEIILAGASLHLGCNHSNCTYTCTFRDYFTKHVSIAKTLHNISDVIIIEHENCLAYKRQYSDYDTKPMEYHKQHLNSFKEWIKNIPECNGLTFKYYFIKLDGSMKELKLE